MKSLAVLAELDLALVLEVVHDGAFQVVSVLGGVDRRVLQILLQILVGPLIRILITLLLLQVPEIPFPMCRNDAVLRLAGELRNVSVHFDAVIIIELVSDVV